MRAVILRSAGMVLGIVACSSDSVPAPANLSGTWNFSYTTTSDAGAACQGAMTFTISQTDQTFVGFQRNTGTLSCTGVTLAVASPNPSNPTEFDGEMISSGVVSPTNVAFQLNTLRGQDAGTVAANGTMMGTSTWTLPVEPNGTITVTGTWTAIRQNQ